MATFRNRPTSTENYRNPDHQKYVTGDGWKSGESKTGAPGEGPSMSKAPEGKAGLKAETARPQASADMTGNQSMPEQKTKLGVSVVCIKPNGGQMGQIKGGDVHAYLGHFRSPEVLKRGHNQGAPGGPLGTPPPVSTVNMPMGQGAKPSPIGGVGNLQGTGAKPSTPRTPPMTSGGGDMPTPPPSMPGTSTGPTSPGTAPSMGGGRTKPKFDAVLNPTLAARQAGANPAGMAAARKAASAIPIGQRRATASAARQSARNENMATRQAAVGEAKSGLKSAIGDVKNARMGLKSAIKGGNVSGAESAFGALKSARGERKIARQGLRKARRG